ncbi:unnamed protein product [Lymnaea stagnalis]|uniref:C-type lectin domain-containing protein n=1 Tax=Lymnaea stagnalis TaxID=6523 RepID=A0AAV2GZ33_LYMST
MGMTRVIYILFLTFTILPDVRSEVPCKWKDSIPSEGACFLYNTSSLSYDDAQASCQLIGGLLAKVTTRTQLLDSTINVDNYISVWIGANDKAVEGTWIWEDRSVATELYELWSKSKKEPSNSTANEDCADIYKDDDELDMFDDPCGELYTFMCMEKVEITTPYQEASTSTTSDPAATVPTTNDSATTEPTTNDSATTEPTTNAILTSTSTGTCPNNSAQFIEFNALLLYLFSVVIYLVI